MSTRMTLGLALASAALLAGCDDSGNAVDVAQGIDTLGPDFVAAFAADPLSEPVDAQSVNLTLTPQVEPFDPNP